MNLTIGSKVSLAFVAGLLGLPATIPVHGCAVVVEREEIRGSGQLAQELREVGTPTGVALMTLGELEIEVTDHAALTIEAEDNLIAQIETVVIDGVLHIRQRDKVHLAPTRPKGEEATRRSANPSPGRVEIRGRGSDLTDNSGRDVPSDSSALS